MCDINGGGTIKISDKRSINCNITNNASGINQLNDIFIKHFLDIDWKNPYGETDPVVYTAKNGSADRDGRMRFCLLYTSPSPRDRTRSRMPSSA